MGAMSKLQDEREELGREEMLTVSELADLTKSSES